MVPAVIRMQKNHRPYEGAMIDIWISYTYTLEVVV